MYIICVDFWNIGTVREGLVSYNSPVERILDVSGWTYPANIV